MRPLQLCATSSDDVFRSNLRGSMVKKGLCAFLLAIAPTVAFAGPITFDLRALSVESVDEVGSFTLASGDLMATISGSPTSLVGQNLLPNRTASSFGVNVDGLAQVNS